MKEKLWFVMHLLFGVGTPSNGASFIPTPATSKKDFHFGKNKLAPYNISMDPLVSISPGLATDKSYTKKARKKEVRAATLNIIRAAQNPEILCGMIAAMQLASCDKSHSLTPLHIEVASKELNKPTGGYYAGSYTFKKQVSNVIRLGVFSIMKNATEQALTFRHEICHALTNAHNQAVCHSPKDDIRKKARFKSNLTLEEQLSAPYDAETKADFAMALLDGEEKMAILKKNITQFGTTNNPVPLETKQLLDCLEMEASQFQLDTPLEQGYWAFLMRVLNKVEHEMKVEKQILPIQKRLLETYAAIFGVLTNYPKLFFYLFPVLRLWHTNSTSSIREYKQCLDEIAPNRLTVTC